MKWRLVIIFFIQLIGILAQEEETTESIPSTTPEPDHPGTYLILAPAVIRPGLPYAVSVHILKSPEERNTIFLEIKSTKNVTIISKTVKNAKKNVPQTVRIDKIPAGKLNPLQRYKIFVRAETFNGKLLFEDEKDVGFRLKSFSTFVQTDKAIYKPGETVKYRVITVSPDLLPRNGTTVSISIVDPNQNVIKQLLDRPLSKGIFSGELDLATEPPLGDWTIQVISRNGVKFEKTFTVDQYVLPKFEVLVKPPPFMTINDNLVVLIDTKYTYGKGVAGKVKVAIEPTYIPWRLETDVNGVTTEAPVYRIEKSLNLKDGKATVTFTKEEMSHHDLLHDYAEIKITATVTEDLTGVERNGTASLTPFSQELKLELEQLGDNYKPGLPYNIAISLKYQDDTPIKAEKNRRIELTTIYFYPYRENATDQPETRSVKIIELDAHGLKMITIQPENNVSSVRVEARYDVMEKNNFTDSEVFSSIYLDPSKSPSNSFIQVIPKSKKAVKAGEKVTFTVRTTEKLPSITYQVMSRGSMVLSRALKLHSSQATITFIANSQMAPKSRLIVYAIRGENKEILVDATDFHVDGIFRNNVALTCDKEEAEPGQEVSFTVRADPHSYVGLLAVDQSVLLLKGGNDLTEKIILNDLENYDTTGYASDYDYSSEEVRLKRRKRSIWFPWWGIGGQDATRLFENSGLLVLTDALLYREPMPKWMPMAMAAAAPGSAFRGGPGSAPRLRTKFPETWIWTDLDTGNNTEVKHTTAAPDTITSWITSAFAINEHSGLGIATSTPKLRVFRPFFIRLQLPYSVKRGEKFALQVLVFNYLDNEQEVTVTLKHDESSGFDFLGKDGAVKNSSGNNLNLNTRIVSVPGGGVSKAVYFPIMPNTIGDIPLHVTAISSGAGDAVEQPLKVEPEGYRVDRNVPVVINLNGSHDFEKKIDFNWPDDFVEGSRRARFDVIGDIMGPILSNLDKLVRMPFGCGEQNMLNFVPNIIVRKYLAATNRKDEQLEAKTIKYMESGYQRELTYKRYDSSFSAFGESDKAGSTWLTAFVVRSFAQAKPLIFVDQQVLSKSIAFLNAQQMETGAFAEHGEVHHKDMQGGASQGGVGLTAYVAIALLENGVQNPVAISFLEKELENIRNDSYTLAVVSYALSLAGSDKKSEALKLLDELKIRGNDGTFHWSSAKGGPEKEKDKDSYFFQPRPVDVETTAYVLLSYMQEGMVDKGLPLVRWLTSQRNALGGFSSTQDTVIALQALAAYAQKVYSPEADATIEVGSGTDSHSVTVNSENAIVLQSYELPNLEKGIKINAKGKGTVFAQLSYSYYRNKLKNEAAFACAQYLEELRSGKRLRLDLCCHYTKPGESNMALAEISALSGYEFDKEEMRLLTSTPGIQRVEFEKADTKANIYLNPLGSEDVCFTLVSDLLHSVVDQKPALIHLFDYYNPEDQLKSTYTTTHSQKLEESCSECWK